MANGVLKNVASSITGNVETAQIVIHDYREMAKNANVGAAGAMNKATALTAMANERMAATAAALSSGTAASYPNSKDKTFQVQFNPSQLTLNASAIPKNQVNATNGSSRTLAVEDAKLYLTTILTFDDMDICDAFMTEQFTAGLTVQGAANMVKMGAQALGLKKANSVQPQVEALVAALRNPYTRTISFRWADFTFTGQLTTVQAQYTMFSTSGRPVRAQVLLRLQHELDPTILKSWYDSLDSSFGRTGGALGKLAGSTKNLLNLNV